MKFCLYYLFGYSEEYCFTCHTKNRQPRRIITYQIKNFEAWKCKSKWVIMRVIVRAIKTKKPNKKEVIFLLDFGKKRLKVWYTHRSIQCNQTQNSLSLGNEKINEINSSILMESHFFFHRLWTKKTEKWKTAIYIKPQIIKKTT